MARGDDSTDRRTEILAAAEEVFNETGYAATTVDAVAERAGISKGSIYNYFESKEALFKQVFDRVAAGEWAGVDEMLREPACACRRMEQIIEYWYGRLEYFRQIGRLVLEFWAIAAGEGREGDIAQSLEDLYTRTHRTVTSIIAQGVADGDFDPHFDPELTATLIVAMLDGIEIQSILHSGLRIDAAFLNALKRNVLRSLGADEPSTAERDEV